MSNSHSATGTLSQATYSRNTIAPACLPDELIHGYLGRIRAINALPLGTSHVSLLEKILPNAEELSGNARLARATAKVSGMTLAQLCQQHTLIPFLRTTAASSPELAHGSPENLALIKLSSFRLATKLRMACPECIREDAAFRGFAYWRRRHQLPGVLWCNNHRVRLIAIEQNFEVCPSVSAISTNEHCGIESFEEFIHNPVLYRYVDIVSGFLESQRPLSFSDAARKLSLRARQMGIRISRKGRRPLLSDIALNSVPKAWLSLVFPGIETKRAGEHFSPIDRVLLHEGLPQGRALALALMFDSAEEALRYWSAPIADDQRHDDESAPGGLNFWNSKKIFNIYVKSEGNRSEIARSIGVHSRRASGELARCGLPSLSGLQFATTGQALMAYYEGMLLSEACAIHGAEFSICDNLIRQGGGRFAEALKRIIRRQSRTKTNLKKVSGRHERETAQAAQTQKRPKVSEDSVSEQALS